MRENRPRSALFFSSAVLLVIACHLQQPNISGVWKGSIQQSYQKGNWQGPAELTLNQKGDGITGTLDLNGTQIPITSGILSRDSLTFSANQLPGDNSIELTFHGKVTGASLTGTVDTTLTGLGVALTGPLTLTRQ